VTRRRNNVRSMGLICGFCGTQLADDFWGDVQLYDPNAAQFG